MIYRKFKIKNFKGIKEIELDLENNRILTLVGLNESGKTTIMEAINLFYTMVKGKDPDTKKLNELRPKGIDFTGSIIIQGILSFEANDFKQIERHWQSLPKTEGEKRKKLNIPDNFGYKFEFDFKLHKYEETSRICTFPVTIKGSKKSVHDVDNPKWQELIKYIKTNLVPEILFYDDFIFQIPNRICFNKIGIPPDPEINSDNNKTWQPVIDDILKSVNPQMIFQEHVVNIWETDKDAASNRLSQMEKVLNEKITLRWSDLFGKDNVNFKEIKIEPEYTGGKLCLSFKIRTQSKKVFSVNERSKGFKWFFSFLLFTEFRKKRTKNILFLLDEPASNLHSSAQAKILDALSELSKDSLVIYSTHSHHLINPNWLSGGYVCINDKLSQQTLAGNLDESEGADISAIKYFNYVAKGLGSDKISYFQPILDRLSYQPSTVEPIPNIVITEGKNDWFTFKYFAEIILKKKFNFYPGAGVNKLWDIIRLYLSWGTNFLVILDGDSAGIEAKQSYEKEFGNFLKNRIFTLEDIFNKKIETEDLIEEDEKKLILDSNFGSGSFDKIKNNRHKLKQNLNYSINQLLVQKKELKLDPSKNNFKQLFQFIKKNL